MHIIDLAKNGAEHFKEFNRVLQSEALYQLSGIISQQINALKKSTFTPPTGKELSYFRPHQGILIEGGRGSGKTTFLLNALHGLTDSPQQWSSGLPERLHVLPVIDPTLIETKEHIIIVIISLIDAALDDFRSAPEVDRTKVDDARREMAEGLGLLDGIGKSAPYGEEWEDATWIMSQGLRKAAKGRSFEVKLQRYIEEALRILRKEAFVLAFDDVDTNFELGRTILETIRKYLTCPMLILMISGDLELYGRLVRRSIYDAFGETVMKFDPVLMGSDKTGIPETVQELEEQYLLKIVPPQNRIAMLPLSAILQTVSASEVKVIPIGSAKEEPLQQWATANIRRQLLEDRISDDGPTPAHPFFELVTQEHLRLVIGYLRALGNPDSTLGRRAVLAVFDTRLRLANVHPMQLAHTTHNNVLQLAFRWLVSQDKPTSLARFGVPSDADKAIILHCFALAIAQGMKGSPAECLRTLLTMNLPISMMQRARYSQLEVRKSILDFIWDDASPDLLEVAGRIGSIARLDTAGERSNKLGFLEASCFGSVGTKKWESRPELLRRMFDVPPAKVSAGVKTVKELESAMTPKKALSAEQWVKSLAEVDDIASLSPQKGVVWFPLDDLTTRSGSFGALLDLLTYDRFSSRGERFRSLSALSLLAAIAKVLADDEVRSLRDMALTSIIPAFLPDAELTRAGETASYDESPAIEEEADADAHEATDQNDFERFIERLRAWHRFARQYTREASQTDPQTLIESSVQNVAEVSPSTLARISERMHDQLLALDGEVTIEWKTGHILHRQITNILHALLVTTSDSMGRLDSPKSSDRPLVEELRRAAANKAKNFHPLAAIVIACPLVWAFLNRNESYISSGSTTFALQDEVKTALGAFQCAKGTAEAAFDPAWLDPPQISIAIGRTKSTPQRTVTQRGFFDLLNVVPRYYPNSSVPK